MDVRVIGPVPDGAAQVYRLQVVTSGSPLLLVIPSDAHGARLTIDGKVETAGGSSPFGWAPLGHGVPSFRLADLTSADDAELSVTGAGTERPRLIPIDPVWERSILAARIDGAFLGLLGTIALLQLAGFWLTREPSIPWYLGFLIGVIAVKTLRDQLLPWEQIAPPYVALVMIEFFMTICLTGMMIVYLRLWREARRLMWWGLGGVAIPLVLADLAVVLDPALQPFAEDLRIVGGIIGLSALTAIAIQRRLAGFVPASYLAFAVVGFMGSVLYQFLSDHDILFSPVLNRWAFEIGTSLDAILFAVAIASRARYVFEEREAIEQRLRETTHDAEHDPLTGVLNRRGFERLMAERNFRAAHVLFVDLDGFKAVNDRGGHAMGDAALILVAAVLRRQLGESDAIARFGGDEFVVVLDGLSDRAAEERVRVFTEAIAEIAPFGQDDPLRIGASIGVAPLGAQDRFEDVLRRADANAYRVKHQKPRVISPVASDARRR